MAARYLSADEVLRRVLNDDSDEDYSDESEAELSEEDDNNGGSEHEESEEDESDGFLPDEANSEESAMCIFSSKKKKQLCQGRDVSVMLMNAMNWSHQGGIAVAHVTRPEGTAAADFIEEKEHEAASPQRPNTIVWVIRGFEF